METYPVMDESGKVREWLDAGRGLRVWRTVEIGAAWRSDMLTPGDVTTAPHWAYVGGDRLIPSANVVFFHKSQVVKDWTDTPAGWKAAERYLGGMSIAEKHDEREAPIGRVLTRYSIERIQLESTERIPFPLAGDKTNTRPLMVDFRVAVVSWVAIIRKEGSE